MRPVNMQVWITRTDISAVKSAEAVKTAGFTPLIAPLLKLVATSVEHAAPPEGCRLAFTSSNGVRAFAALTDRREWPVFTVGRATADMARHFGFTDIQSADGDVAALSALIIASGLDNIVHLSGVHVAGDLVGDLTQAGLTAERTIIYASKAVKALPENAQAALDADAPLAVMLYSPKAAQTFRRLMEAQNMKHVTAVSISPNVDACIEGMNFEARLIAKTPDECAMIAALEVARAKA